MKKTQFNHKIFIKQKCLFISEFTRKFSFRQITTSTVGFIANRQESQRQFKLERWHSDPVISDPFLRRKIDPITSLKTTDEIWNYINDKIDNQTPNDIRRAIRKCSRLNDYQMCWRLFEFAKSKFIADGNTYSDMIYVLNFCDIYKNETKVMRIYYQLMNEMKKFNIKPSVQLMNTVFTFLTHYQQYEEAHNIWNELKNSKSKLLFDLCVWNSYINLNIKQCLLQKVDNKDQLTYILKLFDEMYNIYKVRPNDITFTNIISGVAKLYKRNRKFENNFDDDMKSNVNFVEIGEQLFEQCKVILNHEPYDNVYAAMIDLYGNAGDVEKCIEFLNIVIDKQLSKKVGHKKFYKHLKGNELLEFNEKGYFSANDWSERTLKSCFGSCIKSIINNDTIDVENGWKLLDYIVNDLFVEKCGLKKDVVIYGHLFHCVGSFGEENIDMKKLKSLYKEMIKNGIKPNALGLNNFTIVGHTKYKNNKKKADKLAKWVIKQFIKHKIAMPRVLQVKLMGMMIYHDNSIRNMIRITQTV